MNKIFFVAPYVSDYSGRENTCTPSSITYSKYLIGAFTRLKTKRVIVLSLSGSKDSICYSRKKVEVESHSEIYFRSLPSKWGSLALRLNQIGLYAQLLFYLLCHSKTEDTIVIYHDYGLSFFYKIIRHAIRGKLVYLVGEVFNAVYDRGKKSINTECGRLSNADAYIFANDIMPTFFNNPYKYCICYGDYSYCEQTKLNDDNRIHILYAGKISTGIINDAFIALDVIQYLPKEYVMHIAGYGEGVDIDILRNKINEINNKYNTIRVSYEGNLSGKDYELLLSKCQIGLCTRTLRNELSNYCFPSKTLVYLTHDILPICPQIDILVSSKVSSKLAFVKGELTPQSIAYTITQYGCTSNKYCNKDLINSLDLCFVKRLDETLM